MSNGLVHMTMREYALSGLRVTGVSAIQWFLMYAIISKLICYTRRLLLILVN